jgi:hypothetical protein
MNIRKIVSREPNSTARRSSIGEPKGEPKFRLVDLGEAKAETHGFKGGANDFPISTGKT